jgi:predicted Zn-dependent peptidase
VGGDFNAFTGKEYAGYYVKVADKHVGLALDVLADMLIHSKFDPAEINKERGVIMEEYNMYQDTPMYQIGWDFERLIYGDQPIGWDQVGTKEIIMGLQQADFLKYRDELYTPENTVIAIAGHVEHDSVVEQIEKLFEFEKKKKAYEFLPVKQFEGGKRLYLRNKKTEQAHVMVGFPAYSEQHKDHYAAKLLAIVLGGNMSSRMFLSVREQQGLAYYINSTTDEYTDTGTFTTNAGVSLEGIDKAITAIMKEYKKVLDEPVPQAELKKAQEFLKGKMVLRLEDSEEFAHLIGKYELLYDKMKSPEEIMKAIDKVTAKDLQRVAQDLFKEEAARLAVIGPYEDEERFMKLLKF